MSKIGKQIIKIPTEVSVDFESNCILIKGPKGKLTVPILNGIKIKIEDDEIKRIPVNEDKQTMSNWGTVSALIKNAIIGVTKGFEKKLILKGMGYKVMQEENNLVMNLGFSHQVNYKCPEGINFEVEKNTNLKVIGIDKVLVGQVAAKIRAFRKPNPYKGTGFRYSDETLILKEGKKTVSES